MRANRKPRILGQSQELPLLYSEPMVNAVLDDRKTQTRRTRGLDEINKNPDRYYFDGFSMAGGHLDALMWDKEKGGAIVVPCPYGRHMDKLWVRENFKISGIDADEENAYATVLYMADMKERLSEPLDGYWSDKKTAAGQAMNFYKKKGVVPNIFLPRWASRLLLEIVEIKVERLSDITEDDAKAEGAMYHDGHGVGHSGWRHDQNDGYVFSTARNSFFHLWRKINGEDSLKSNPWVWVIYFKKL